MTAGQREMTHHCPMCGRAFEPESDFEPRVACPSCGTLVSDWAGGAMLVDPEAARQKARPPAIGLMIVGGLVILAGMAGPAMIAGVLLTEGLPPAGDGDRTGFVVLLVVIAVFGFVALLAGASIIAGGYSMYHLRRWGLALFASIVTSMSFLACCVLGIVGLLGFMTAPVGLWALVVLNDSNVRAAFH